MSYKSAISWTDSTWSPIIGCSKISAGCQNCYAEKQAARLANMSVPGYCDGVVELDEARDVYLRKWTGETIMLPAALTKPLHWKNSRKIFVCSMSDLFHESVPFEWIAKVFAVMKMCPQHEFKVLTKRAGRMRDIFDGTKHAFGTAVLTEARLWAKDNGFTIPYCHVGWPLPNVHLGVTVENNDNTTRITDLLNTPAAKRFISFEPLLETTFLHGMLGIDYAFIGCESGPKARLCTQGDIGYMMAQCRECDVKIHVKQIPLNGKCNKNIGEWPEEFRIREI